MEKSTEFQRTWSEAERTFIRVWYNDDMAQKNTRWMDILSVILSTLAGLFSSLKSKIPADDKEA